MRENFSKADELKKMKDLLDSGAITQSEFDKQKDSILGSEPHVPPSQPVAPQDQTPTPALSSLQKKNRKGCLISVIVVVLGVVFAIVGAIQSSNGFTGKVNSNLPLEEQQAIWLAFDTKTWEGFTNLYTSHNNLMKSMDAFSSHNISSVDLYSKCTEAEEYFRNASLSFDYGTNKEERTYLSVFKSAALSDQMTAKSLMAYLDSNKTSDLSKAQKEIQSAVKAYTTIASNRGILLVKAGLTDEQIKAKVEADLANLG